MRNFFSVVVFSLLSMIPSPAARAYDVFFHGEGARFVKTETVWVQKRPYVLFSTCEVQDQKFALCVDRVMVLKRKLLKGTTGDLAAGYGAGALFTTLSVGTTALILVATGGNPLAANALGFGLFGMGLMGSVGSAGLWVETYRYHQVVANKVAQDVDHSLRLVSYSDFVNQLLKATSSGRDGEMFSLRADSLKPARTEPYWSELTAAQIEWLRIVSGQLK